MIFATMGLKNRLKFRKPSIAGRMAAAMTCWMNLDPFSWEVGQPPKQPALADYEFPQPTSMGRRT